MKKLALFISAFFVLLFSLDVSAQEKRNMTIVDFLNVPSLSSPQLSPDGSHVIYVLAESDWEENRQISHIWRQETNGDNSIQLTNGERGESNPSWSPNGDYILFQARRASDENTQAYVIRTIGGEAQRLTNHPTGISNVEWSTDGKSIYFLARDEKSEEDQMRDKIDDDVYSFENDYTHRHLWKMGIKDDSATKITMGDFSINSFQLSSQGETIIHSRTITPLLGDRHSAEIWIMDNSGGSAKQLTTNEFAESGARISPDGSQILFIGSVNQGFDPYYDSNLFLMDAEGGEAVLHMEDNGYGVSNAQWANDGKSIYLELNMGVQEQIWEYELSSKSLTQITSGTHSINSWSYHPENDHHVFSINTSVNPGDIYTMKDRNSRSFRKITRVYDYIDAEFNIPKEEVITWESEDGEMVEGILRYPINYSPDQRYPLVVQTHGGPRSSDKLGFSRRTSHYHPVLTGLGYAVLQPNYRGSTGYGDDFLRDMVGSYFRNAHLDVMTGVDHLIDEGIVDPNRLIKMGWSAGGHMTNKIITFTDRFKAASSGAGAANWMSMYSQSDVRTNRTPWFGGTPWEENAPVDVYWNNSPLKDVHNVTTPTLLLVGGNDVRVPKQQSIEMYRGLKSNGVETQLHIAPREPHGWRELRHRLYKVNLELGWYAKYALEEEYTWEEAPSN